MTDLDVDFVLKAKGETKHLSVGALTVTLSWRGAVDLDLVAFYQAQDGREGGIFSTNYLGGNLGDVKQFPFLELSGDELESAGDERSEEVMRVAKLDELKYVYILAMNHTDASQGRARSFAQIDVRVEVKTDRGQRFRVPLNSTIPGEVALLCKLDNTNRITGPQLVNDARVMRLDEFYQQIPGARSLQVTQKLVLRAKGASGALSRTRLDAPVHATLRWTEPVDLDLHCFYLPKGSGVTSGLFGGLFGGLFSSAPKALQIYFGERGSLQKAPFIRLDQDAGIGDEGGENEENIEIASTSTVDALLFVANIFNKPNALFGTYDGCVRVRSGAHEIEVPLSSQKEGAWAWVALIDCRQDELQVINVNHVSRQKPTGSDLLKLLSKRRNV